MKNKKEIRQKKRLRLVLVICGAMLISGIIFIITVRWMSNVYKTPGDGLNNIEYSTEFAPVEERFPDLLGIEKVYWKDDTVGRIYFKPNYYITGFILLNVSEAEKLRRSYNDWSEIVINFPDGLQSEITGFNDFEWHSSYYFKEDKFKANAYGEIYFDFNNGVIYFEYTSD